MTPEQKYRKKFASEAGKANVAKHGKEWMAYISKQGRASLLKKDPDAYLKLAKAGNEARRKKKEAMLAKAEDIAEQND